MKLHHQITVAKGGLWLCGGVLPLLATQLHVTGFVGTALWLVCSPPTIHKRIIPVLFPYARCRNRKCGYRTNLEDNWVIAGYRNPAVAHAFSVYGRHGEEVGSFDCSKCGCTTILQVGRPVKLVKATMNSPRVLAPTERIPVEHRLLSWRRWLGKSERGEAKFTIGVHRKMQFTSWQLRFRRLLSKPLSLPVSVLPSTAGKHMAFIGATGSGKSNLMTDIIQQKMEAGEGVTVIDPTGDLIDEVLKRVPDTRKDEVLLWRIGDPDCPLRLNVLHAQGEIQQFNLNTEVLRSIKSLSRNWGDNINLYLDQTIDSVKQFGGSLQDAYDMLTKTTYRYQMMNSISDPELLDFWENVWPNLSSEMRNRVVNKLRPFIRHPWMGKILCSRENNFNADEIIQQKKIVLLDLNTGTHESTCNDIVGRFVFTRMIAMVWYFGNESKKKGSKVKRTLHTVFVDEAHNYMDREMGLRQILSEARKFRLTLAVATTEIGLLGELAKTVTNNVGLLSVFQCGADDAAKLSKEFEEVEPAELQTFEVGECYVRNDRRTVAVRTRYPLPVPDDSEATVAYIEQKMQATADKLDPVDVISSEAEKPASLPTHRVLPSLSATLPPVVDGVC